MTATRISVNNSAESGMVATWKAMTDMRIARAANARNAYIR